MCGGVHRGVHGGARRGAQRCIEVHRGVHGGARRCTEVHRGVHGGVHGGFLLDNIFSRSVCISLEYPIKGVSIFLDYHLLLRFHTGKLYVWRGARRGARRCVIFIQPSLNCRMMPLMMN